MGLNLRTGVQFPSPPPSSSRTALCSRRLFLFIQSRLSHAPSLLLSLQSLRALKGQGRGRYRATLSSRRLSSKVLSRSVPPLRLFREKPAGFSRVGTGADELKSTLHSKPGRFCGTARFFATLPCSLAAFRRSAFSINFLRLFHNR